MIPLSPADTPRSLGDPLEAARRRTLLNRPHMKALTAFVRRLRTDPAFGLVPDFDPCDGGVNARLLFLLEKPSARLGDTGFVSRNNANPTAASILAFMQEARLPREATLIWNIVPGWNGTSQITQAEVKRGLDSLKKLLRLLPQLRAAVLVGQHAARARPLFDALGLPTLATIHPSPNNRAARLADWLRIGHVWAKAHAYLGEAT